MKTVKMYYLDQNNSGGHFISTREVYKKGKVYPVSYVGTFEGFYHIGVIDIKDIPVDWINNNSQYCECCGERWHTYGLSLIDVVVFESPQELKDKLHTLGEYSLYTCEFEE